MGQNFPDRSACYAAENRFAVGDMADHGRLAVT